MKILLKPQVPSGKIKLNLKPHVNLLQTKDFKERCMGEDTQFLMYDGNVKCIADLKSGDLLMSENSTPVKVMSIRSTYADMYQINVIKGDPIVVSTDYNLCVKLSNTGSAYRNKSKTKWVAEWVSRGQDGLPKFVSRTLDCETIEEARAYIENSSDRIKHHEVCNLSCK